MSEIRLMRCPFCGFETQTKHIGAVHCGPHRLSDGSYLEARQMSEAFARAPRPRSRSLGPPKGAQIIDLMQVLKDSLKARAEKSKPAAADPEVKP